VRPIRVAIADDHRVVLRSLQAYLESFPEFQVVGTAVSGEELLECLATWRPDVVLQDLLMPATASGLQIEEMAISVRCVRG
jgi:two-component system, NarL family, response regulator LiaR